MQEQMERVCQGLDEVTEVLVEVSSVFATCVYEQRSDAGILRDTDCSSNGVNEEASTNSAVLLADVDGKTS